MNDAGFHISIGTGPSDTSLGKVTLEHDLRLVKAALLYADRVTLYSPAASFLLALQNLKDPSRNTFQIRHRCGSRGSA